MVRELSYAGIAYSPRDETQILVAFNGLRAHENGYEVEVEWGSGSGREPTRMWYKKWYTKVFERGTKRDILPLLKKEIENGKTIVFRDHAPYTTCWLAIIGLGHSLKLLDPEETVLLHSNLTGHKGILNSYVTSPWPVIDMHRQWYVNHNAWTFLGKGTEISFKSNDPEEQVCEAIKGNMLPCMTMGLNKKGNPVCILQCDRLCPTHKVSSPTHLWCDAFNPCYSARCKSMLGQKLRPQWVENTKDRW